MRLKSGTLAAIFSAALTFGQLHAAEEAVFEEVLSDEAVSEEAEALIAPVFEAYAQVDSEHAALPPPVDVAEMLVSMGEIDQAGRIAWEVIDLSGLPGEQKLLAADLVADEINRRDLENQTRLTAILPASGWFLMSEIGEEAFHAAFLIVQHAVNDPALQDGVLAAMEPHLGTDEIDGQSFGLLYDRVAIMDGRHQRYGSQMICQDSQWALYPVEQLMGVNERREQAGFELSLEQNLARFEDRPPCVSEFTGALPE